MTGITGDRMVVLQPLDVAGVRLRLQEIHDHGIRGLAVVLMHAYAWPGHELAVGRLAWEMRFTYVPLSFRVMPLKVVPCSFEGGGLATGFFNPKGLGAGHRLEGPALIIHDTKTIRVAPGRAAEITAWGDGVLRVGRPGGRVVNLGAKNQIRDRPGDRLRMLTPGGGGYGEPDA